MDKEIHGVRGTEREGKDDVKRHRQKTAISETMRETGSASFHDGPRWDQPC